DAEKTLAACSIDAEANKLLPRVSLINRAFAGATVERVLQNLEREAAGQGEDAVIAKTQADAIRTKSPPSLKIAHEQMRIGATLDFAGAMRTEFRIVNRVARGHDFYEGVRAVVVDKDNQPRWNPPTLAEVGAAEVGAYFAPLPTGELPQT